MESQLERIMTETILKEVFLKEFPSIKAQQKKFQEEITVKSELIVNSQQMVKWWRVRQFDWYRNKFLTFIKLDNFTTDTFTTVA